MLKVWKKKTNITLTIIIECLNMHEYASINRILNIFFSAVWLSRGQLWGNVSGAVWLTWNIKGHLEPHNEVGSQSPAEPLVGFVAP